MVRRRRREDSEVASSSENQDSMTHEQPLPKVRSKRGIGWIVLDVCMCLVAVWAAFHTERLQPSTLAAFALGAALLLLPLSLSFLRKRERRCPECSLEMSMRPDYIPGTTRYRCLYDCPCCHITWDSGEIVDKGGVSCREPGNQTG
jgi:hypothetical protein